MSNPIIIGIDHGYAAMKTAHYSFPTGLVAYTHEPYSSDHVLEYGGQFYVIGSGRQALQKDKTATESYYLLTLAAIAMEVDNQVPNAATCRSLELGVIRCLNEISEQLRRTLGLSLTNTQIESVMRGATTTLPREAKELIQRETERYTARLLSAIQECGLDYRAMPMVVLGGGASILARHVSPSAGLCGLFTLENDKRNAQGFQRLCERMSAGREVAE